MTKNVCQMLSFARNAHRSIVKPMLVTIEQFIAAVTRSFRIRKEHII